MKEREQEDGEARGSISGVAEGKEMAGGAHIAGGGGAEIDHKYSTRRGGAARAVRRRERRLLERNDIASGVDLQTLISG